MGVEGVAACAGGICGRIGGGGGTGTTAGGAGVKVYGSGTLCTQNWAGNTMSKRLNKRKCTTTHLGR